PFLREGPRVTEVRAVIDAAAEQDSPMSCSVKRHAGTLSRCGRVLRSQAPPRRSVPHPSVIHVLSAVAAEHHNFPPKRIECHAHSPAWLRRLSRVLLGPISTIPGPRIV